MAQKQMETLVRACKRRQGEYVKTGRGWCGHYMNGVFELIHYGTLILTVDGKDAELGHGFSNSDRDAINSVLQIMEINDRRARIRYGVMQWN